MMILCGKLFYLQDKNLHNRLLELTIIDINMTHVLIFEMEIFYNSYGTKII